MAYAAGSPMGSQLEIGIALVLQDRFSNQAREASSVIKGLHNDAKNAVAANLQTAGNLARQGLNTSTAMARTLSDAVVFGADYLDTMVTVKSITSATEEEMDRLSTTAKKLGLDTMFSAKDIASGMQFLAMAGNTAAEIDEMIRGATYVAGATGMQLGGKGGTADVITNVMRAFKIESAEAAVVVGDMLTKGTMSANTSMTDLAEAIRYTAADMVNLKMELPQVIAMIGALGDSGIQGSMAGTALSNMARYTMKSITQPSYKGAKALAMLGLTREDLTDAKGELLDFGVVLTKISKAMEGKDIQSLERAGVFLEIFGVRGNRAAIALLNNMDRYHELVNLISNESEGFSQSVVQSRMEELKGQINIMKTSYSNLKIAFTEAIGPVLIPFFKTLSWINDVLQRIFSSKYGPFLAGLTAISVATLGIASALTLVRTKWLILKNDSMITGKSMFSLLMGGWDGARLKAERYMAVENAIIAQRKAGIMGNTGLAVAGATGANIAGYAVTNVNGTTRYRDVTTGRFVKASTAKAAMAGATGGHLAKQAMGGAARKGAMTAGAGMLGTIGKGLGSILKVMTGPWGLAIMAASFILPKLYSAIVNSKRTNEENTSAVKMLSDNMKAEMDSRMPEAYRNLELVEELRALVNSMYYWADKAIDKPGVNLTLIQDGKKVFEEYIDSREETLNIDLGTK